MFFCRFCGILCRRSCHLQERVCNFFIFHPKPIISFSCSIEWARTFSTILITSEEQAYPCFVLSLWGKAFSFYLLSYISAVRFHRFPLSGKYPFIPTLLKIYFFGESWLLTTITAIWKTYKCIFFMYLFLGC